MTIAECRGAYACLTCDQCTTSRPNGECDCCTEREIRVGRYERDARAAEIQAIRHAARWHVWWSGPDGPAHETPISQSMNLDPIRAYLHAAQTLACWRSPSEHAARNRHETLRAGGAITSERERFDGGQGREVWVVMEPPR